MRLGVLVSGTGSILESIIASGIPIAVVVADRRCRGLDVATDAGVTAQLVDRGEFGGFTDGFDRASYTRRLVEVLASHEVELVAMAGFGTILSRDIHDAYPERILNTHPSLLPAFPGWHSVEEALAAGVEVTGCTVHLATLETDAGPVLSQEEVPVLTGDTVDTLHERIKKVERRLYPATIERFIAQLPLEGSSVRGDGR